PQRAESGLWLQDRCPGPYTRSRDQHQGGGVCGPRRRASYGLGQSHDGPRNDPGRQLSVLPAASARRRRLWLPERREGFPLFPLMGVGVQPAANMSIAHGKYHIWTVGCQMNQADSQRIASILDGLGWDETPTMEGANLVVLNTCSVRE